MNAPEIAEKILDSMLGHLGLPARIELEETDEGACLQIFSSEKDTIVGENGDRLDDLQYLVNRVLRRQVKDAPRIRVDCEHFRSIQEDKLHEEVLEMIELVKSSGKTYRMRPLNAYYRRLAYNTIAQAEGISASSPKGDTRVKRISISPKKS